MTYVLSDIHGQLRRFESVLKQINLRSDDTLYVLGDVIDRNPDGIRILKRILKMPNAKMLLGNHEYMMLKALYYAHGDGEQADAARQRCLAHWYRNGGGVTHDHLKRLTKEARAQLFSALDALPLNIDIEVNGKKYLLTHAAPADLFDTYGQKYKDAREFAVWWRCIDSVPARPDQTIIFGHTGTHHYQVDNPMKIWHGDNLIGIDCGSSYPEGGDLLTGRIGRLACLRLDDMKTFYSEEPAPQII